MRKTSILILVLLSLIIKPSISCTSKVREYSANPVMIHEENNVCKWQDKSADNDESTLKMIQYPNKICQKEEVCSITLKPTKVIPKGATHLIVRMSYDLVSNDIQQTSGTLLVEFEDDPERLSSKIIPLENSNSMMSMAIPTDGHSGNVLLTFYIGTTCQENIKRIPETSSFFIENIWFEKRSPSRRSPKK